MNAHSHLVMLHIMTCVYRYCTLVVVLKWGTFLIHDAHTRVYTYHWSGYSGEYSFTCRDVTQQMY